MPKTILSLFLNDMHNSAFHFLYTITIKIAVFIKCYKTVTKTFIYINCTENALSVG